MNRIIPDNDAERSRKSWNERQPPHCQGVEHGDGGHFCRRGDSADDAADDDQDQQEGRGRARGDTKPGSGEAPGRGPAQVPA
jgi:hypothetical protein